MKKLLVAFVLILCVVLFVFAFASCGKKTADATTADQGTTPATSGVQPTSPAATTAEPTTEPEETEPVCDHVPEEDWFVETAATCTTPGVEKLYCVVCGAELDERPIEIDPGAHVVTEWTVTREADVLGDGSREGVCSNCNNPVVEVIAFKPNVWTTNDSGASDWKVKRHLSDALDGDHFYPTDENPNGKDYYFEIDFLWNETITSNWVDGNGFRIELVNADSTRDNLFLLVPKNNVWGSSDAKASGGFDYGWAATHAIVYGPKGVNGTGTNAENFPNIGAYGWHRIGVQVHEEAAVSGNGVAYTIYSTLYIDGAKVWQISYTGDFSKWIERNLMLFTATNNNGVLEYADPAGDLCLDFSAWSSMQGADVYVVRGNVKSILVDPDFEPDVEKVETPEAATFTLDDNDTAEDTTDDVTCPAAIYFRQKAAE